MLDRNSTADSLPLVLKMCTNLGEGQLAPQIKIMDVESIIYTWMNKDSSNANFTFSSNKLDMKAQFNLK